MFCCVSDRILIAQKSVQNGPNWCNEWKNSTKEVMLKFFLTNAPDPPHRTLTHVLVPFRPFRHYTKIDAKWAELVQLLHKLVQRSHVRIFWNERTRSTPFDPKLMIWCVSDWYVTAEKSM
jgi:hypothetical protein